MLLPTSPVSMASDHPANTKKQKPSQTEWSGWVCGGRGKD
jgi:hypothetical protein